jgi:hypothetical protein
MKCQKSCGMCTKKKSNFKCQQCGKGKEGTLLIQMATMHSKLGIPLPNLVQNFSTTQFWDFAPS